MFPVPEFCITGLNPDQWYICSLEFSPVDAKRRYNYKKDEGWFPAEKLSRNIAVPRRYDHPDKAFLGAYLLKKGIAFNHCKLTNAATSAENVTLNVFQRYQLGIIITKVGSQSAAWRFIFPETVFITVTKYYNETVIKMKINNNPFAAGFRKKRSRRKLRPVLPVGEGIDSLLMDISEQYGTAAHEQQEEQRKKGRNIERRP
ncbi:hypothetical protein ACROYT_G019505 [Oculina patagonica]